MKLCKPFLRITYMNSTQMIIGVVGFVSILGMTSPVYARERIATKPGAIKAIVRGRATIGLGKLTAINGTTLTVERDGKSYTVLTGTFDKCTTKFKCTTPTPPQRGGDCIEFG
jgi:hypothetical protein